MESSSITHCKDAVFMRRNRFCIQYNTRCIYLAVAKVQSFQTNWKGKITCGYHILYSQVFELRSDKSHLHKTRQYIESGGVVIISYHLACWPGSQTQQYLKHHLTNFLDDSLKFSGPLSRIFWALAPCNNHFSRCKY